MYKWFDDLTRVPKPNREKEDYHHYGLYEVEILNSLFRNHNVQTVLSLGGMSNLDFFLDLNMIMMSSLLRILMK